MSLRKVQLKWSINIFFLTVSLKTLPAPQGCLAPIQRKPFPAACSLSSGGEADLLSLALQDPHVGRGAQVSKDRKTAKQQSKQRRKRQRMKAKAETRKCCCRLSLPRAVLKMALHLGFWHWMYTRFTVKEWWPLEERPVYHSCLTADQLQYYSVQRGPPI